MDRLYEMGIIVVVRYSKGRPKVSVAGRSWAEAQHVGNQYWQNVHV